MTRALILLILCLSLTPLHAQTALIGAPIGPQGPAGPAGAAGANGAPGQSYALPAAWSAATTYAAYDVVTYLGSTYAALKASTGVVPGTDSASWALMAQKGADGTSGKDGAPGVPGYNPNSMLSGGTVTWVSGMSYIVSSATYLINNTQYSSAQSTVTLAAADATLNRIDVIAVNDQGAVVVIEGTPAEAPVKPTVDPATQLEVTQANVDAGQATPTGVTKTLVYAENAGGPTEWTATVSGAGMAANSTATPITGSYDVLAAAATTGQYVQFAPSAPFTLSTRNNLAFAIKSTATWNSKRSVQVYFMLSGVRTGSIVTLNEGAFGFTTSNTTTTQNLSIPLSLFQVTGTVDALRFVIAGSQTAIGFRLDDVSLQGGIVAGTAPTALTWRGVWNGSVSYAVNDVVRGPNGAAYVALVSNVNSTPASTNANWAALSTNTDKASWGLCTGTDCATGTNLTSYWPALEALTFKSCVAVAKTGPVGAALIFDINVGGASIFGGGTHLQIADGQTSGTIAVFATPAVAANALVSIDIDQTGVGTKGKDVTVACRLE